MSKILSAPKLEKRSKSHLRPVLLKLVSEGWSLTKACKDVGISRTAVDNWRKKDPKFAEALAHAYDEGTDFIVDEIKRRGIDGYEVPIIHKGQITGHYKEYSDQLAVELLRLRRPLKYGGSDWRGPNIKVPTASDGITRVIVDAEFVDVQDAPPCEPAALLTKED